MSSALEQGRARLSEAVSRERRGLIRFARSRLADAADLDAEDVVADVVLRLFERADLLAQVENLTAYLFRAVGNSLSDLFRRRRAVEELSDQREDPAATPEAALQQVQLRERLEAALDRLSPPERAVWVAVEVEGWTFRELSERWGEPLGTLLSRKNRATKALRIWLGAERQGAAEGEAAP